jgi:hypothetical protein
MPLAQEGGSSILGARRFGPPNRYGAAGRLDYVRGRTTHASSVGMDPLHLDQSGLCNGALGAGAGQGWSHELPTWPVGRPATAAPVAKLVDAADLESA